MAVRRCGSIALSDPNRDWELPVSCRTAALLLRELLRHNFRAINRRVLQVLGIDIKARHRESNFVYADDGTRRVLDAIEMRSINKALAMELLSACAFTCLDSPIEVRCWCQLNDQGRPKSYAANGHEDITVEYEGFAVVVEVSARKEMNAINYRRQILQAIDKAGKALEASPYKPIYALVINEGGLERHPMYGNIYVELEPDAQSKGPVRLVPIWAKDFAEIVLTLSDPDRDVGLRFEAEGLAAAFDRVYDHIAVGYRQPLTAGWMRATILAALEGKPFPEDEESDSQNGGPEPASAD